MDGYKATYTIRHCEPFISDQQIQDTPIVAMTASAIQGDREKCENAGCNDYLAKPVKGKTLEQMLLKWVAEKKRKSTSTSNPTVVPVPSSESTPKPSHETTKLENAAQQGGQPGLVASPIRSAQQPSDALETKLNKLAFQNDSVFARSAETAESRSMDRLRNEEKAMQLRDQQLFASATAPKKPQGTSDEQATAQEVMTDARPSRLTRENIEKLTRTGPIDRVGQPDVDTSSLDVAVDSTTQQRSGRPSIGNRMKSNGERTVLLER